MLFGGGEFLMELVDTISVPTFDSAWLDFCRYYSKPFDRYSKRMLNGFQQMQLRQSKSAYHTLFLIRILD